MKLRKLKRAFQRITPEGRHLVIGVPFGIIIGWFRRIEALVDPLLTFFYASPRIALTPLMIVWFGIGIESKAVIVGLMAIFPIIINVAMGVRTVDRSLVNVGRGFQANSFQMLLTIALPSALPSLTAGIRLGIGQALVERFDGDVPGRLADLVTLPGVGRKTANVVLAEAFGVPGITVDTHLGRLARRWGWTVEDDPVKVEADVAALIERRHWTLTCHQVIWHGRRVCHARRPACGACPVAQLCPSYGIGPTDPGVAATLVRAAGWGAGQGR